MCSTNTRLRTRGIVRATSTEVEGVEGSDMLSKEKENKKNVISSWSYLMENTAVQHVADKR